MFSECFECLAGIACGLLILGPVVALTWGLIRYTGIAALGFTKPEDDPNPDAKK